MSFNQLKQKSEEEKLEKEFSFFNYSDLTKKENIELINITVKFWTVTLIMFILGGTIANYLK